MDRVDGDDRGETNSPLIYRDKVMIIYREKVPYVLKRNRVKKIKLDTEKHIVLLGHILGVEDFFDPSKIKLDMDISIKDHNFLLSGFEF